MCRFLSAIVMPNGTVKCEPMLDSHSDLVRLFGLDDTADPSVVQRFAKVEFTPPADNTGMCDLDKWSLRVDEPTEPDWWLGVRDKAIASLRATVDRMIVRGERDIVVGGCWLVARGGRINKLTGGRIVGCEPAADLAGVTIHGTDLYGANLRGVNLQTALLYATNLGDANLSKANLSGANLSDANLRGANLTDANLSDALLGANFADANLSGANLRGANLRYAHLGGWRRGATGFAEMEMVK